MARERIKDIVGQDRNVYVDTRSLPLVLAPSIKSYRTIFSAEDGDPFYENAGGDPTCIADDFTISWVHTSTGVYTGTAPGTIPFPLGRTCCHAPSYPKAFYGTEFSADLVRATDNTLTLTIRDPGGSLVDGFQRMFILVEVF